MVPGLGHPARRRRSVLGARRSSPTRWSGCRCRCCSRPVGRTSSSSRRSSSTSASRLAASTSGLTVGPWTHISLLTKGGHRILTEALDWFGEHLGGIGAPHPRRAGQRVRHRRRPVARSRRAGRRPRRSACCTSSPVAVSATSRRRSAAPPRSPTTPPTPRHRSAAGCSMPRTAATRTTAPSPSGPTWPPSPARRSPRRSTCIGTPVLGAGARLRQPARRPVRAAVRGEARRQLPERQRGVPSGWILARAPTLDPARARRDRAPLLGGQPDPPRDRRRLPPAMGAQPRHRRRPGHVERDGPVEADDRPRRPRTSAAEPGLLAVDG